jgi:ligand-binding sensor domain-containing protein/signal transduction histidine kinase
VSLSTVTRQFSRFGFALTLLCCVLPLLSSTTRAEQLPLRVYTSADGLGQNRVKRIVRDSRGFLWFCTADGLSRFDGYRFTTYDTSQGLPYPSINDLLETRKGVYWLASNGGGVFRFNLSEGAHDRGGAPENAKDTQARSRFVVYKLGDTPRMNRPNRLFEDAAGRIWAGTDDGLFVLDESAGTDAFQRVEFENARRDAVIPVWAFAEDDERRLWVATSAGLWRREPDGRIVAFPVRPHIPGAVWDVVKDASGRMWVGHSNGLLIFKLPDAHENFSPNESSGLRVHAGAGETVGRAQSSSQLSSSSQLLLPDEAGEAYAYTKADGLVHNVLRQIHHAADGRIWLGTASGLSLFGAQNFSNYTTAHGLSDDNIRALAEDRDGNLWIGTETGGAIKLARHGLVTYREADGLQGTQVRDIFETRTGLLCVITDNGFINYFDGQRFAAVRPNIPPEIKQFMGVVEDERGDWWIGTSGFGLYRFSGVRHISELARARSVRYTSQNGLSSDSVTRVFEDSRGDIWLGMDSEHVLARWERAADKFHTYREGLPGRSQVLSFAEDKSGAVWAGFREGGAARYREGRFDLFNESSGLTADEILKMYVDDAGRLWLGSNSYGLVRIDDPAAQRPVFRIYSTAEGLTSGIIRSIAEDNFQRLYLGTSRSVDRFDLATNRIKRYTIADGLAANESQVAYRDRQGALWFGTWNGISRLVPEPERLASPPPVMIDNLQIAGVRHPVSDLGETNIEGLRLESNQNQVQIDFLGLGFGAGELLRYQYKLEGAGVADWSAPTDARSVTFANLSPGSYRFLVRAVNTDGVESATPASVTFQILRPIWLRPWFLLLAALLVGGLIFAVARYRLKRLVELERVRTRIATDLHDDIGSSLSQIAILSEVVSQRVPQDNAPVIEPLSLIAGTSREMVDSMSDIVWAINPQRDHLSDLTQRMRRFASDILSARDIDFRFRAPDAEKDIRLGADLRREVYLIFKECVNNLVKHSGCTEAELELRIVNHWIVLRISDDGRGFDTAAPSGDNGNGNGASLGGHGLLSMHRRAVALGGTFEVKSAKGRGTVSTLKVPARGRRPASDLVRDGWRKLLHK